MGIPWPFYAFNLWDSLKSERKWGDKERGNDMQERPTGGSELGPPLGIH